MAGAELLGARELHASIEQANGELADLSTAHAQTGHTIAAAASAIAPHRTGRLAGSGQGGASGGRAVVTFGGPSVPYAAVIEYGWAARGIRPQPYATTAAQRTEPQWTAFYEAEVARIIGDIHGV